MDVPSDTDSEKTCSSLCSFQCLNFKRSHDQKDVSFTDELILFKAKGSEYLQKDNNSRGAEHSLAKHHTKVPRKYLKSVSSKSSLEMATRNLPECSVLNPSRVTAFRDGNNTEHTEPPTSHVHPGGKVVSSEFPCRGNLVKCKPKEGVTALAVSLAAFANKTFLPNKKTNLSFGARGETYSDNKLLTERRAADSFLTQTQRSLHSLQVNFLEASYGLKILRYPLKLACSKYGQDLSAFAMPLIGSDISENMTDPSEYGRPRSSSGSTALKGLLSGKSKSRNKSVEREDKKDKVKKPGFFDQFRPRSKSDVSGLKRPAKKSSLPTEHSMDESTLMAQTNHKSFGGSQETITPMSQILEGQMLNVPEDERVRHKSGPSTYRDGGFMSKFRARSNSESKPRSPKRTLQSQKSLSPPSSPRADRSGLSPLKLQTGEPRSAPPQMHRTSLFNDHTHAIIYKTDVLNKLSSVDSDHMEIEDLDENEDQVFAKFMRAHRCYDLIPTSAKLVIFDTQLNVKKAFFALIYNGVRAAPLWDTEKQDYVGMLTITDFIYILKRVYKAPDVRMDELEDHKIQNWREMVKEKQRPFVYIGPDASLYDAIKTLIERHVHRLPVIDEVTGNAIYILTHKRILRFLYLYIKELPQPSFMKSSIKELGIGTYKNVITATPETPLITALNTFMDHRISALPVVNDSGEVINIYAKFDVINLAADKSYNNLDITLGEALKHRNSGEQSEMVATCHQWETLSSVMEKIVKAEVHRLVVVDEENHVEGIVSLSDLLNYIVLRPMEAATKAPVVEPTSLEDQAPPVEQATSAEPDMMVTESPPVYS